MARPAPFIAIAIALGIAVVYLLPIAWLGLMSASAVICTVILAVIVRISTRTQPPKNPMASVLLSLFNLPEQPLAKVKEGWVLTAFLTSAAFLVSLGLSVIVRAHT